ncbi:hypothetical protein KVT40_008457 [Elsinoe batatas]|uniref:Uncharacterized protein n=1 Tax=Elsinoe batatas TaxID=2601811 RepID=A0A8K0KWX9_9PEZI|nr:hypothetical protein KVT40_008457 [Elsinoe batatas]
MAYIVAASLDEKETRHSLVIIEMKHCFSQRHLDLVTDIGQLFATKRVNRNLRHCLGHPCVYINGYEADYLYSWYEGSFLVRRSGAGISVSKCFRSTDRGIRSVRFALLALFYRLRHHPSTKRALVRLQTRNHFSGRATVSSSWTSDFAAIMEVERVSDNRRRRSARLRGAGV